MAERDYPRHGDSQHQRPQTKGASKGGTPPTSDPPHQDGPPTPADGLGPLCDLISDADTTNQSHKPGMMKWAVQGLVQETQSPDKSGRYKGPTDEDRSQLCSVTVLVHKNHREEISRMYKDQMPCTIQALGAQTES